MWGGWTAAVAVAAMLGTASLGVEALQWMPRPVLRQEGQGAAGPLGRTGHHYANPFGGSCYMGDLNVTIQQLNGAFCSPPCVNPTSSKPSCPELPGAKEHNAEVSCVLSQSGNPRPTLCAILCLIQGEDGAEETGSEGGLGIGGNCPGSSVCERVQDNVGICLYHGAAEWADAPEEERLEAARATYDSLPTAFVRGRGGGPPME